MTPPTPPIERLSQLSIESMPPTTRLQSRSQQEGADSDSDGSSVHADMDEENVIAFPSGLVYSLDHLDEETQSRVQVAIDSPLQYVLQACQAQNDHVIFRVSEVVEHSIRFGSGDSSWAEPECSCKDYIPCSHTLWLFDQITNQTLPDLGKVLKLRTEGYSDDLADPYEAVSGFHLDVLAESLHSRVSESPPLNRRRVQEIREILASVQATAVDKYRPDLFDEPVYGENVIQKRDLECTIFRMLLHNNEFFQYFLSSMESDELVNNQFRKLEQRADCVLAGYDAYTRDQDRSGSSQGRPKNAEWCGNHLRLVTQQIQSILNNADEPPSDREYRGAAGVLLHVLREVVDRHTPAAEESAQWSSESTLYSHLVGDDSDTDFVVGVLNQIPPANLGHRLSDMERILDLAKNHGTPAGYGKKLDDLIARVRKARSAAGKRQAASQSAGPGSPAKRPR